MEIIRILQNQTILCQRENAPRNNGSPMQHHALGEPASTVV